MAALLNSVMLLQQGYKVQGFLALRRAYNGFGALPLNEGDESAEARYVRSYSQFGYGMFTMLLAYLPARVLAVINFVGFVGDKEVLFYSQTVFNSHGQP